MEDTGSEVSSDRPATFEAAFAADVTPATDSQAVTPAPETPAVESASADATVPPTSEPTSDVTPALAGTIPTERHKAILDGAYRERDEARTQLQALQQQAGWLGSEEGQRLQQWSQAFRTNPREWFARTAQELVQHYPDMAKDLRSDAARILAGGRGQADVDLSPDIPVMDDKGQVVAQTYSATRVQAIVAKAVQDAITKEIGPMRQTVQSVEAERATRAASAEATSTATRLYQKAQAWDGFTEHEQEIAQAFAQHPEWSLEDAYIAVVPKKLRAQESARTLDALKTKAAASSVNPATAASTSSRRPASFHDPALTWG
jgi:hypothetical protein